HSALAGRGIAAAVGVGVVSGALLVAAVAAPGLRLGGRSVGALDVAALGAAALARGSLGPGELAAQGGTAWLVLLLPLLVAFVAAVVAARLLGPALRVLERRTRGGAIGLRLATLSLARRPGRAGAV